MSVTLDLPPDAMARLQSEAVRRGITLDELVAELSNHFPFAREPWANDALSQFIGSGDSGYSRYP